MMHGRLVVPLVVAVAAAGTGSPKRYADMTPQQMSQVLAGAQKVPRLEDRLTAVSDPFVGTPYALGNMGEGPDGDGRDTDPRFNVASADCTTFVEHALAFALSADLTAARKRLDRIRYVDGKVGYGSRRHWPEAQWVPGLIADGYLVDVTRLLAGADAKVEQARVTLTPQAFEKSAHKASMPLTVAELPQGTFDVPYVRLAEVTRLAGRLDNGLVVNVVKAPRADLLVRISHQGLVVRKHGKVFVRHASSVGPKAVMDEPLADFVKRQGAARKWPTVGLQFLRIHQPPS